MNTAIVFGCGSGRGATITNMLLSQNYKVINIGSQLHDQCENIVVDWRHLNIHNLHQFLPKVAKVDFLFFNQNSSSLDQGAFAPNQIDTVIQSWKLMKDWQHSHWLSCQMPFLTIKYLTPVLGSASKIGWMLSSTMYSDRPEVGKFPDYSSQKYFNFLAMKSFAAYYETFGILPDFCMPHSEDLLARFIITACNSRVHGKIFDMKKIGADN